MPEFFIDGQAFQAEPNQTVMQAAAAHGVVIPGLCWHPQLSAPGHCRLCTVEVEAEGGGPGWLDIACNMPVTAGLRVRTASERVRARQKDTLQFITLNHPVDCGICDKAGECTLQDHHYQYNGAASISMESKVHTSKHFALSSRIVLDNERCVLCSRCVRFTHEISKSHALGIQQRGDQSLVRPVEDGSFEDDPYSDNVIDLCPVGALLSRPTLHTLRVWYLQATPSVCPGCERGCNIHIWHRKAVWALQRVNTQQNTQIARITPRENPAVNGPWICNKGRDLAAFFERPRAHQALLAGRAVDLPTAIDAARVLIDAARRPVALVSSAASNEELAAFQLALAPRITSFVKRDFLPTAGERIEDGLLIKPDKNPNRAAAGALFPAWPEDASAAQAAMATDTDLVMVWGEGAIATPWPATAKVIRLGSYEQPENWLADVFLPISVQTERSGHYTNFAGVVSHFEACFDKPATVADAATLFTALGRQR